MARIVLLGLQLLKGIIKLLGVVDNNIGLPVANILSQRDIAIATGDRFHAGIASRINIAAVVADIDGF